MLPRVCKCSAHLGFVLWWRWSIPEAEQSKKKDNVTRNLWLPVGGGTVSPESGKRENQRAWGTQTPRRTCYKLMESYRRTHGDGALAQNQPPPHTLLCVRAVSQISDLLSTVWKSSHGHRARAGQPLPRLAQTPGGFSSGKCHQNEKKPTWAYERSVPMITDRVLFFVKAIPQVVFRTCTIQLRHHVRAWAAQREIIVHHAKRWAAAKLPARNLGVLRVLQVSTRFQPGSKIEDFHIACTSVQATGLFQRHKTLGQVSRALVSDNDIWQESTGSHVLVGEELPMTPSGIHPQHSSGCWAFSGSHAGGRRGWGSSGQVRPRAQGHDEDPGRQTHHQLWLQLGRRTSRKNPHGEQVY